MYSDLWLYFLLLSISYAIGWVASRQLVTMLAHRANRLLQGRAWRAVIRAIALGPNLVGAGDGVLLLPTYAAILLQVYHDWHNVVIQLFILFFLFTIFLAGSYFGDALCPRKRPE